MILHFDVDLVINHSHCEGGSTTTQYQTQVRFALVSIMGSIPDHQPDGVSDSSSESNILDTRNDEGWEDIENDEEVTTVISLFDTRTFPDARSMLVYCRENHGFDIWRLRQEHGEYHICEETDFR